MKINIPILLLATVMALLDCCMMICIKKYYLGDFNLFFGLIIPMIIYGLQPLLFYKAMYYEGMGIFNILWDSLSNLLVLLIGVCFFLENVTTQKYIGVVLSFISIFLMITN